MATLSQYLSTLPHGAKQALAERVGIPPSYLSQLLSGSRKPRKALRERFAEATEGAVDPLSWDQDPAEAGA